mmetsp:Transcript_28557/g.60266  ORF Transcript_28557/g.60266 Transcript_28557/m.60266 type:complete len:195 (-) Transcript_28557:320-904(-)
MHLRAIAGAFCSFGATPNANDASRPIIPFNSFAHKSSFRDGFEIRPAPDGKGMGAFSTVTIAKGATLGEYTGEVLTRREVEARYWGTKRENKHDRKWRKSRKQRNQGISGDYLFDMGNNLFIDGEDADVSSWCRFANHADELNDMGKNNDACNVEVRRRLSWEEDEEQLRLFLVALREIEPGTEICYDYGGDYW